MLIESVGFALKVFEDQKSTATVNSILKLVFTTVEHMPPAERKEFFNSMSLTELEKKLNLLGPGWAPPVEEELKARGLTSTTYLKNYPREIRRFVEQAKRIRPVTDKSDEVLPEWDPLLRSVKAMLPSSTERLKAMVNEGITMFAGYDAEGKLLEVIKRRLGNMRSCFLRLAKQASACQLIPETFGKSVVIPGAFDDIPMLVGKPMAYYHCKDVWNELMTIHPSLYLPLWGDAQVRVSIPAESIPENLQEGIEQALIEGNGLTENTKISYRGSMTTFFGILETEGYSVFRIAMGLMPRDAIRLFSMGIERSLLVDDPERDNPRAIARRIHDDSEFREKVLASMRDMEGSNEGRTAFPNPFVSIVLEDRIADEKIDAARQLINRISTINRRYFAATDHHCAWITRESKRVKALKRTQETEYFEKKKAAFAHPRLWSPLLERMAQVAETLIAQAGNPDLEWARTVCRACIMYTILLYPIRRDHFRQMCFEKNYDVRTYQIQFGRDEVKNEKAFRYTLPVGGRGRKVRALMNLYLQVARPILLHGRESPFVFVPEQTRENANLHLRKTALNDFFPDFAEQYFADILPVDLLKLNPHIIRHIVASYALVVEKDLKLAAQLLNDHPTTVLKHYSDVLESSHDELLDYHEEADEAK